MLRKTNLSLFVTTACVYFYPRYKAYRKSNKDKSRFRCISDILDISWPTTSTSGTNSDSNLTEPLVDERGNLDESGHVL